jgi:hypothetical protein
MKKKLFLICLLLTIFTLTGCVKTKETKTPSDGPVEIVEDIKPNLQVGYLKYYVPEDFKSNPDKIGLAYNDNTRKIYTNIDIDDAEVILIDAYATSYEKDVSAYAEEINQKLTDVEDVKFKIVKQSKLSKSGTLVYGREDYLLNSDNGPRVYYAYVITIGGYLHTVSISGPTYKSTDVKELAYQILQSFDKV